nr:unnamed protein product [Callosobruchus analis]
MEQNCWDQTR